MLVLHTKRSGHLHVIVFHDSSLAKVLGGLKGAKAHLANCRTIPSLLKLVLVWPVCADEVGQVVGALLRFGSLYVSVY